MWTNPRSFSIRKPWRLKKSKPIVERSKGDKCMPTATPVHQNSICDIPLTECVCVCVPLPHSPHCSTPAYSALSNILLSLPLSSVKNLHDRWAKDCSTFRELYNQMPDLELKPRINWGPLFDEKQVSWKFNWHFFFFFSSQTFGSWATLNMLSRSRTHSFSQLFP